MINSRKLIIILSSLLFVLLFSSNSLSDDTRKEEVLLTKTIEILQAAHFSPKAIDDTFSEQVFHLYMQTLDYNKIYFTQEQYSILETYIHKIDDELREQSLDFFILSLELLQNQIEFVSSLYTEILSQPLDYDTEESIVIDPEQRTFVKNNAELTDFWRKFLKYQVVDEIVVSEDNQKKEFETNDTLTLKTFDEIEKEARERIRKRYETRFKRLEKITKDDRFSSYANCITSAYDPHTNYFPPKEKEDFDIRISGKLEGIGATLSEKDGYIRVVSIVPGSPSWKQGDLQPNDLIQKVTQKDGEAVDVGDMRLDEAVQLIRGPKGTEVTLTVKKVDGTIMDITIVRDIVQLEEQYARSAIFNSPTQGDIGYIYLPQFYVDMNDRKGRNCADDMRLEIEKLKNENISGIIVDLRDNGGGSLPGVVDIAGLFIEKGPIVQVMVGTNKQVLYDKDARVQYNGPLVILVNSFSASASEILAAAMQDYSRAVIVGTQSTYGKGTVQRFVDIDRFVESTYNNYKPFGSLKLTIQKFYRINGGSTQLKGVVPDIILPDIYQHIEIGEKDLDYPMAWTEIDKEKYQTWNQKLNIRKLARLSAQRVEKDSGFVLIQDASTWLADKRQDSAINLSLTEYRVKKHIDNELAEKYAQANKNKTQLQIKAPYMPATIEDVGLDSIKTQRISEWHQKLTEDVTLYETYKIMCDLIRQQKR